MSAGKGNNSSTAKLIARISIVQQEMILDRGYTFDHQEGFSFIYHRSVINKLQSGEEKTSASEKEYLIVYYIIPRGDKLTIDDFTDFNTVIGYSRQSQSFTKTVYKDIVLILPDWESNTTIKAALENYSVYPRFQVFTHKHLTYNPTKRVDAPLKTELVPLNEEEALLKDLKCSRSQLPLIAKDDPIVKYYGWPERRIVRFYRLSELEIIARVSIYYRFISS